MNILLVGIAWLLVSFILATTLGRMIKYHRDGTLQPVRQDDDEQWEYFNRK